MGWSRSLVLLPLAAACAQPRTGTGSAKANATVKNATERMVKFVLANGAKSYPAGNVNTWYSSSAMPQLGALEAARTFPDLAGVVNPWVGGLLDAWLEDGQPAARGLACAHWGHWCDENGVPPAVYAAAARHNDTHPRDLEVVRAFAEQALKFPHTNAVDGLASLPSGAVARSTAGRWRVPPLPHSNATQITWPDDCFMCTAALTHAAPVLKAQGLLDEAARRLLAVLRSGQRDAMDGLLWHGYDTLTGEHSCCKWGDGNGWVLMALADTIKGYTALHSTDPHRGGLENSTAPRPGELNNSTVPRWPGHLEDTTLYADMELEMEIVAAFQALASAWLGAQDPATGLWHQLLDDTTTYLSSSATGFALYALATGVKAGVLARASTWPLIAKGWASLAGRVTPSGFVTHLSNGYGINANRAEYLVQSNASILWGFGAVLRAAAIIGEDAAV